MSDTEPKSIANIKTEKKLKKVLSPEALLVRQNNAKKAREAREANVESKNKLKLVEYNISNLINGNDISSDEEIEPIKKSSKVKSQNVFEEDKKKESVINNHDINNDYKVLLDHITNINKKVEKLYIMKKNKPIKQTMPVYVNTKGEGNSNDLLSAIRNKMLNS